MLILMRHPAHGQMYVYSTYDMEQAQKQGWEKSPAKVAVEPEIVAPVVAEVAPQKRTYTKRAK